MRRIIHNTTAIAACLSLLAPHLAQAQPVPEEAPQPAEQAQPQPPQQEVQAEQPAPAAEPQAAAPEPQGTPEPQAAAPEPAPEPQQPAAQQAAPEEPAAPQAPAAPEQAAEPQAERPAQAAREQQQERPVEAARAPDQEGKPARAEERAARQSAEEQAIQEGQAERPEAAARQQDQERPEAAARQQQQERPEQAVREQGQDRPAPEQQADRPAPQGGEAGQAATTAGRAPEAPAADPLGEALEEQRSQEIPAPAAEGQAQGQGQGRAPVAQRPAPEQPQTETPDENALRDELARKLGQQPGAAEGQPQPQQAGQPAAGAAPAEANAPVTEAAQQAAQETGVAAGAAAALNEDTQGEVVEQQITEENSRSSSEDFATSLRDALQPQQPQADQRADNADNDDDNDLAKALLLGLGAVAVGSYLNNNRQVALSAPDRVVVTRADGSQEVIKDEVALLRQPGSTVATENFDDGSSRTVVTRADGSRVVTIRDADLRVLRRTLVSADGTQTRLIDDTAEVEPVDIATLPAPAPVPVATPGVAQDEAALREALRREVAVDRRFTLGQVRSIPEVRALVPPVTIDAITFDTGSAAITPDQARQLSTLGGVIQDAIAENPREVFLIEGHTDAVGSDAANLALSDRRAESVALALSEYFQVPPENLVVQGYGEQFLQVRQEGDVRENRRAAVRRITDLLQTAQAE